ncbi:MAG: DUF99 family protein [Candidatus Hydrothermarchaeales archaeon]
MVGNMRLHVHKKGLRVLGIAESFRKGEGKKSVLSGVVMRGDLQIDGFALTTITVGGMDATEGVLRLFHDLKREDINLILLNGCVIAWFNIIDLREIFRQLKIPLICVTYEESEGLEKYFKDYFEDSDERIRLYKSLGARIPLTLYTGHEVLVRFFGIEEEREVKAILDRFTIQGAVPEPLKLARLLARAALDWQRLII